MTTTVKVYLNEGDDHFFGFRNKFGNAPALRLAAQFDLLDEPALQPDREPTRILNHVYEQLNVGGDMVPAEPWTTVYRVNRNRSLSVGDVVVVGESAWAVASCGFESITTEALVAAIQKES
jgi:hypothetical protein